jgi:DNA-binding response OmpR family regulator
MKRRILLVDDEVAVLLTLKAILEINGFDVETAASAREARHLLMTREYNMIVTDMRMETETAGAEVIHLARTIPSRPAIAMLTAFPVAEEDWRELGAHQMLVKPMNTYVLLQQIELLLVAHEDKKLQATAANTVAKATAKKPVAKAKMPAAKTKKPAAKAKKLTARKTVVKKAAKKVVAKSIKKAAKKIVKPAKSAKSKPKKSAPVKSKVSKAKPAKKAAPAKKKLVKKKK